MNPLIKFGVIYEILFLQMTSVLTKEQKERIEAKRQLALLRRKERQKLQNQHPSLSNVNNSSDKPSNSGEWHGPHDESCHTPDTHIVKREPCTLNPYPKEIHHQRKISLSTVEVVTGSCRLLSKERFTVIVPYQEQLIDIFKSFDSKIYGKILLFC
jgi:hypothetical protein